MGSLDGFMPILVRSLVEQEVERQAESIKLIRKGDKGDKGLKGDIGLQGPQGIEGLQGPMGPMGPQGLPGRDGLNGTVSLENVRELVDLLLTNEPDRFKGAPGKDGDAGTPGARVRGEWKSGEKYFEGDLVALGGDWWYADNSGPESRPGRGTKWKLFVQSRAGRLSGYGVVQGQGGGSGGITSLTIGTTPITGGTVGRLLLEGAGNVLQENANLNFDTATNTLTAGVLAGSGLINGRVALIGTSGVITDDAGLTFDTSTDALTASGRFFSGATSVNSISYSFVGDTDTGYGYRTTDTLTMIVANGEALRVGTTAVSVISRDLLIGASTKGIQFSPADNTGTTSDSSIGRPAPNAVIFGNGTIAAGGGTAASRTCLNKPVTAYSDGVAKASATFTVPNAAHSAGFELVVKGAIGAGGAIGAKEASRDQLYRGVITRTPGLATAVQLSAAVTDITCAVAGATTLAQAVAVSAISGANSATQTFTIDVTLTKGGGSSDNHTAFLYIEEINDNASGVTVA